MQHRHLLPNEIDLLLDGESGFGVAPLRNHVEECAACRTRLADARVIVLALERMPHFVPSHGFTDAVMSQVQVVEPLHVAAVDTVRRWLPQSAPARVLMGVGAATAATVVTITGVWVSLNGNATAFAWNLLSDRVRGVVVGGASTVLRDVFGTGGVAATTASSVALLAGGAVVLAATSWAAFTLLSRTVSARRARS